MVVHIVDGECYLCREWRGFVWNGKLNALGQYFHPLYFSNLSNDQDLVTSIGNDCLEKFEEIKVSFFYST